MIIGTKKIKTEYTRKSKTGKLHSYSRYKNIVVLKCDSCNIIFEREQGKMNPKRIRSEFLHVCTNCNQKQFAQKVGVSSRKFWNTLADSDIDITKL